MKLKSLISLGLIGWAYGQQDNMKISMMDRQSLHDYSLAKCSDGSPAAYYIDKVSNKEFYNNRGFFKKPQYQTCFTICRKQVIQKKE